MLPPAFSDVGNLHHNDPWDWQKSKKVTWLVVCYAMKFALSPVQVEIFSQSCSLERTLLLRGITEHETTEGQIAKLIVQHGNRWIWQSHLRVEAESKLLSDWLSPDVLPSSEVSSSQFGLWSSGRGCQRLATRKKLSVNTINDIIATTDLRCNGSRWQITFSDRDQTLWHHKGLEPQ